MTSTSICQMSRFHDDNLSAPHERVPLNFESWLCRPGLWNWIPDPPNGKRALYQWSQLYTFEFTCKFKRKSIFFLTVYKTELEMKKTTDESKRDGATDKRHTFKGFSKAVSLAAKLSPKSQRKKDKAKSNIAELKVTVCSCQFCRKSTVIICQNSSVQHWLAFPFHWTRSVDCRCNTVTSCPKILLK